MFRVSYRQLVKDFLFGGLCLCLGMLLGSIPLLLKVGTDPFDEPSSYGIWVGGIFVVSGLISFLKENRVWRWALAVGLGFPIVVVLAIILHPDAYSLFPLTLAFSFLVALPPAFAGAYIGKRFV